MSNLPTDNKWNMAKHRVYVLILAVLWIIFLIVFQPQKRWGHHGDTEKKPDAEMTASSQPSEPEIPARLSNSIGMEFIYIPPGTFMMGSLPDEVGRYDDRETCHQVTLTSGFYMQTTEVTQKQWATVMKTNPSFFINCGEDCPAEQVSWNDVRQFIWKLNQSERLNKYSLPTEAQWEYACRAGNGSRFNWGNDPDCSEANYGASFIHHECKGINPGKPVKTASFSPNGLGLYDMHGNVAEWCMDRFDSYPSKNAVDPAGSYSGAERVFRGGSWGVGSRYCRSANRDSGSPDMRTGELGFRLIRRH